MVEARCDVAADARIHRRRGIGRVGKKPHHGRSLLRLAQPKAHHATKRSRHSGDRVLDLGVGPRDFNLPSGPGRAASSRASASLSAK
jgi:hypothetical protein